MDNPDIYHYERINTRRQPRSGHAVAGWALFAVVVGGISAMLA